ncbi:coiled-coil domain-containing protein 93-like isoform X1 [Apteryx rowi]|uniref:coiled-coil domain-containing protein 93-like isoform X1 n=1 Tax=Apteryx rowi TaxID=308060 RepID=UPI000E1C67A2|nr:coiled-coil domain-containing protein 93-like isoform X1 [Apteryx rowi]
MARPGCACTQGGCGRTTERGRGNPVAAGWEHPLGLGVAAGGADVTGSAAGRRLPQTEGMAVPRGQEYQAPQEVETREDEEQNIKLTEILELLVAAGYFRARIKGLSPFDKVVGGMTWCITTCNFDIDVDLLFQENSTIGQKIALTEKIVSVLPKMKCPHRLEPHQIQGLDFIHIFPVVQFHLHVKMHP